MDYFSIIIFTSFKMKTWGQIHSAKMQIPTLKTRTLGSVFDFYDIRSSSHRLQVLYVIEFNTRVHSAKFGDAVYVTFNMAPFHQENVTRFCSTSKWRVKLNVNEGNIYGLKY